MSPEVLTLIRDVLARCERMQDKLTTLIGQLEQEDSSAPTEP